MKTISHSGLVLVRNCLRQYRHSYIQLRKPRSIAPALSFGSIWDKALTAWHHGKNPFDRLVRGDGVLAQHPNAVQRETARAMLTGYTTMWAEHPVETVATQVSFDVPILHPETGEAHPEYQFNGVLDGIVRVGGRLLGLESKTSSEDINPGSPYWQRIVTLDPQVSLYDLGARQAGFEIEGILYDVARKPALKLGKTETPEAFGERCARDIQGRPDYYYQRQEVVRLESEARAYQQDLWDYACILSDAERLGRWPRNPDRCRQFGRACDFLPVCVGEASVDDEILYMTRERGKTDGTTRQDPERPAA
jgi:hypothetical protein